jgi:hypothetical protein
LTTIHLWFGAKVNDAIFFSKGKTPEGSDETTKERRRERDRRMRAEGMKNQSEKENESEGI